VHSVTSPLISFLNSFSESVDVASLRAIRLIVQLTMSRRPEGLRQVVKLRGTLRRPIVAVYAQNYQVRA